jgi:hypothetical protein
MTYLQTGELTVSNAAQLMGRGELNHINDLIQEYDEIGTLLQNAEAQRLSMGLPVSVREKVSRMIDTELRARESEIKATLQNQFQVKV